MPAIYYSYYTPISDSISDVNRQEHELGRTLLIQGIRDLFQIPLTRDEINTILTPDIMISYFCIIYI